MSNEPQIATDQKTSIAPMLSVRHGAKAVEFYKAAFGAGELFRIDNEKGEVVARLSVEGPNFGLPMSPQSTRISAPSPWAAVRCGW